MVSRCMVGCFSFVHNHHVDISWVHTVTCIVESLASSLHAGTKTFFHNLCMIKKCMHEWLSSWSKLLFKLSAKLNTLVVLYCKSIEYRKSTSDKAITMCACMDDRNTSFFFFIIIKYYYCNYTDFVFNFNDDDDEFILYGEGFQRRCSLHIES